MVRKLLEQRLASLLFPPRCCRCECLLPETDQERPADFCRPCLETLSDQESPSCPKCGARVRGLAGEIDCPLCRHPGLRFTRSVALGNYRGVLKEQVLRMKREGNEILAYQFGRLLGSSLIKSGLTDIDLMTPIPTDWWRRLKTGFHAADVMCDGIRQETGFRKNNRLLRTTRRTLKQGKLTMSQRFANLDGALRVAHGSVKGKTVLVVDDVMTSGATAGQATRTLLAAGAIRVYMAVAARGGRLS
ncbi:MAG: hypothetical protein MK108_14665 [Mariniblastus sp.]|nr:hypothetical protein [Mariniblastus sp.]